MMSRGGIVRLKELREKKGISQLKLEWGLICTKTVLAVMKPESVRLLVLFADYFNISIDYLLGRTENPTFLQK